MNWELSHNKGLGSRTAVVVAGVLGEAAETVFTRGHCHAMAYALHQATGWPLVGVYYVGDDDAPTDGKWSGGWEDTPGHVVVRRPDGLLVDVLGAWAEDEEALEGWGVPETYIDLSPDEVLALEKAGYRPISTGLAAAESLVESVLARAAEREEARELV